MIKHAHGLVTDPDDVSKLQEHQRSRYVRNGDWSLILPKASDARRDGLGKAR